MRSWVVVALALLRATPRCAAGEARGGGAGFHIVSRLASETEDVLQPLFALLRSAERGAVDIRRGAIRKDKLTAAVFVDGAAALRAAAALAPRFPWCDFRRDAQADQAARAEATAAAKAGRTVVVTDVVGTVFQGSLARLAADGAARVYTTARVGAAATPPNLTAVPCSIVAALRCAEAGACTTVFPPGAFAASDAARHRYHLGAAACQQVVFDGGCKARTDAFGAVVAGCGLGVVPVVHGVGARASDCKWAAAVWAQYEVGQAHRAANTNAKTRKKWAALGLGEERFGDRERLAVEAQIAMPDLFTSDFSAPNCSASAGAKRRDVIFTVYNYPDAATLYFFLRSLRGAGCVSDVVVFTHKAHAELRAVAEAYGATCLEYFAPLTGNAQVASIMARPHMQALKKDFPGRLIKNYKFTFMYCYLLEFGQKFQRAAFMDVRDVYFQRDPFQAAACRGLTASTETAALSVYDRRLIHSDHYPLHCDTRWAEFQGVPPINSGVFIADVDTMMGLVHQTDAILEKCGAGYDQGTFTELVYLRQIRAPVTLHTTEHGPIAMICNSLSVQIDAYGTVVNERGDAYAVVHQFDRFDELNALVARTMPYDASKFREACKSGGRRRRRLQQDLGPSSEEASLVASAAARSAAPLSAVAGPAASVPGRRRTELPSDVVFTEVSLSTPVRVSWEAGVTVVAVAHFAGGDATRAREAAHFLATLIMTLPLANVQIVASEDDAALLGDVVAHFRMRARQRGGDVGLVRLRGGESYVSAVRTLLSAAPAGAVVVTDVAGVIWQSDVSRPALRELAGDGAVAFASPPCRGGGAGCCFGSGQTTCTLVGAAAAVAAALSGSVASNPAASAALAAFFGAGEGCVVNAYAEAAPSAAAAPYLAVHGAARCAALRRRLSTFDWVAAPVGGAAGDKGCEAGGAAWCRAPLSRLKNLQRTIALAKASGVEHLGGLEAADRIRAAVPQRFPRYAPPPRASARPDCLLVGAADYQNPGFYARFLRSLREAGADCDVTIFTNGASHAGVDRIFRKYRARWLEFFPANATKNQGVWGGENTRAVRAKAFATLPGNGRAASTYRFLFFYYYFLQAPHSRVGWTDVRDVVFQADPFALRPALAVFTETARFTLEHKKRVYLDWSKSAWGYDCDAAFGAYAYLPPVNLGAVFGDRGAVLKALAELVKDLRKCGGWDQFVFSKLAYTQLDAQAYTTDDGPVANLCSNVDVRLGAMREVVNERREVYSVVHQWDRFDALVETYDARYPFAE